MIKPVSSVAVAFRMNDYPVSFWGLGWVGLGWVVGWVVDWVDGINLTVSTGWVTVITSLS